MTMRNPSEIYGLWPSIGEMAVALDEAPSDLIRRRQAGEIPDPRHDKKIVARAIDRGVYLRMNHLAEIRNFQSRSGVRDRDADAVRKLFDAVGGPANMSRRTGASRNAMRIASSRGRIPLKWRAAVKAVAEELGEPTDLSIFDVR